MYNETIIVYPNLGANPVDHTTMPTGISLLPLIEIEVLVSSVGNKWKTDYSLFGKHNEITYLTFKINICFENQTRSDLKIIK